MALVEKNLKRKRYSVNWDQSENPYKALTFFKTISPTDNQTVINFINE